jgi:tetratricopeptide (TPR) repeat protein
MEYVARQHQLANAYPQDPDGLDAHPLVREYFGDRLREDHPDAWREGHSRLYEHLRDNTKELPDTIDEMAPLFAAVTHGCHAGRHQEVLSEMFYPRVRRGNQQLSIHKLGAIGSDLVALSGFFDPPWARPVARLRGTDQAWVLNEAGFDLRALGRLREAAQAMRTALDRRLAEEIWLNAATNAGNLSELHLTMGEVEQALHDARQSMELSDRSGDAFQRMIGRTTLAYALHQAGRAAEAQALFSEAEQMQKERQPEYPLLFSFQGYLYCDLLLGQGEHEEVRRRAIKGLEWSERQEFLLDIALDHLSLGRAVLLESRRDNSGDLSEPADHLDQAVEGLRRTGAQDDLPRGLLARAELRRIAGNFDTARADLDEALAIAERGSMRLHQADAHLEYARLHLALGDKDKARESLATASQMIDDMGYHRRDGEVQELKAQLG